MQNIYQVKINKNYNDWYYTDLLENKVNIHFNPIEYKLFNEDIIVETSAYEDNNVLGVTSNTEQPTIINTIKVIDSTVRKNKNIPGVLILKNNKTYGRYEKDDNKTGKLLYKCIPDDKCLPPFLIPYESKTTSFSKIYSNLYVTFSFSRWNKEDKHPIGILSSVIGEVNSKDTTTYYEYQLVCKNLNISINNFNKQLLNNIKLRFDSSTLELSKIDNDFIFMQYPLLENRTLQTEWNIFTIDSVNTTDFDDAFSIKQINHNISQLTEKYIVSIYISNVCLWLELFNLWNSVSNRVSNIYLPDKKVSMLPTLLSSNLCSLTENEYRYAFTMDVIVSVQSYENSNEKEAFIENIEFKNSIINVCKNYSYSQLSLHENIYYKKLLEITKLLSQKYVCYYDVDDSENMVAYLMILMNYYCSKNLKKYNTGILLKNNITHIPRITDNYTQLNKLNTHKNLKNYVKSWHLSKSEYISFKELDIDNTTISTVHESLEIDSYTHITSPIRRIVDLVNLIEIQKINGLVQFSKEAITFCKKWSSNEFVNYINTNMKSIRKLQNECNLLDMYYNLHEFTKNIYDGYIIDIHTKNKNNINKIVYTVYIPELKITSKINKVLTQINDLEPTINNSLYSHIKCKLYVFTDEYNIHQKIKLEELP
jgi:exoribonuclease R